MWRSAGIRRRTLTCSGGSGTRTRRGERAPAPLQRPAAWRAWVRPLRRQDWVVYAKPPFGGPEQVLKYLARYTHRVAISNDRLLGLDDGKVQFRWKDYR